MNKIKHWDAPVAMGIDVGSTTVKVVVSLVVLVVIVAAMSGLFHAKVEPGQTARRVDPSEIVPVAVELRTVDRITPAVGTIRAVHEAAVASRLLAEARSRFREAGIERLRTMVRRNDVPMLSFFRSAGFVGGSFVQLETGIEEGR